MIHFEDLYSITGKPITSLSLTELLEQNNSRELILERNDSYFPVDKEWVNVLEQLKDKSYVPLTPGLFFSDSFQNLFRNGVVLGHVDSSSVYIRPSRNSVDYPGFHTCRSGPLYSTVNVIAIRDNNGFLKSVAELLHLEKPTYKPIFTGLRLVA